MKNKFRPLRFLLPTSYFLLFASAALANEPLTVKPAATPGGPQDVVSTQKPNFQANQFYYLGTAINFGNGANQTPKLDGSGLLPVANLPTAAADGSSKGIAAFLAADFNSSSGVISIDYTNGQAASSITKGFLPAADWSLFNAKVATSRTINTTAPITGGGDLSADRTIAMPAATTSANGYLASTDWNIFNNKVPATRTLTAGNGLTGGGDLSADRTFNVGAGNGITVNADDVALTTPGTLTYNSINSSSENHTHAITSSSNPGAAASILATDSSGFLTIPRLTATGYLFVNNSVANLYLKDLNSGWQVASTQVITPQSGNSLRSTSFASGVNGWTLDPNYAEFENIRARGEIASSVFKVNELSATAGTLGVFYSASTMSAACLTASAPGGGMTFYARNSDSGGMLFAVGDVVRFKAWTGAGVSDAWATVATRTNNGADTTYTAAFNSGSTSTVFYAGTAIVDYGTSGTGVITLSADGTVGSSPNLTMATHAGSPWSAQTIRLRAGNLNGTHGYATNIYGVAIGPYGTTASWLTADDTNGLRLGSNTTTRIQLLPDGSGFLANSNISWNTSGALTVAGNATIAGWMINSTSITSGGTLSFRPRLRPRTKSMSGRAPLTTPTPPSTWTARASSRSRIS